MRNSRISLLLAFVQEKANLDVALSTMWLVVGDLRGRSLTGTCPQSGGRANHLDSPPHLGHVSLRLSNLIESDKLFISVPPSLGRGGCSLLNAMRQGPSQRCEAVIQPEGHVLGSFLSRLAGAWAAESPGHRGLLSKEASPHQYGGHTRDVLHGKHRAAPCHWEICGGHQTDQLTAEKAGLQALGDSSESTNFH